MNLDMENTGDLYPLGIRDNPFMQAMFSSFCSFAMNSKSPDFRKAFEEETGIKMARATSGIDAAIDRATGHDPFAVYAEKFLQWLIKNHWGYEGMPDDDLADGL